MLTKYLAVAAEAGGDPRSSAAKMLNARPKKPAPEGDGNWWSREPPRLQQPRLDSVLND